MSRVVMLLVVLSMGVAVQAQSRGQAPRPPSPPAKPATPPVPAPPPAPAQSPTASPPAAAVASSAVALTDEQKTTYALGLLMQRSLRPFDLSAEEIEIVKRAVLDATAGTPAVDLNEWGPKVQPLATSRSQRAMAREKAAATAYLDTAAGESGAIRTPSGLVYRDLTVGSGLSPTARDTVKVNYRGTLISGTVFDSSYDRNEPAVFALAGVVPCWTEGVQRMKVGGKARLVCPANLAYGDAGSPTIPGGAALVFEVELLEILGVSVTPN